MDVTEVVVDRAEARARYLEYRAHRQFETPVDAEIKRAYRAIAQGSVVIKALQSIVDAGAHADGTPKLGLMRADQPRCMFSRGIDGNFALYAPGHNRWRSAGDLRFNFPAGSLPVQKDATPSGWWRDREAIMPIIPLRLRPQGKDLWKFHILWEADWNLTVPVDPMLLRRLGKGDLWVVCAAWDLTEIERAALAARVTTN
jgi:hypothetical protein